MIEDKTDLDHKNSSGASIYEGELSIGDHFNVVILRHYIRGAISYRVESFSYRIFSSKQKAEKWLKDNGYIYGRHIFMKYKDDAYQWCHRSNNPFEFVLGDIDYVSIDDISICEYSKHMNERKIEYEHYVVSKEDNEGFDKLGENIK